MTPARPLSGKEAVGLLLFSLPFVLAGGFFGLMGFGVIPPTGQMNAPNGSSARRDWFF
jgi:hypothetical protein